jgi:glycosyltransferase involved in cell wall biosynthesis
MNAAEPRPVRVCFLIDELAAAGTETQLLALIRHVDRQRVLPYLVLLRGDGESSRALEPDCCPVLRLGVGSLKSPSTASRAWRFVQFLWRERIDVVQAYFPDSSYFGVTTAWLAGVPHRIRTRNNVGHWVTSLHRLLGRALNRFTTATIANCDAARASLLRDEKPNPDSVFVLANGVDLDRFLSLQPPSVQNNVVGAVSNLRPVKGLDVLVDAAARLKGDFPGLCWRVAGEGEQRGELQARIASAGLGERFDLCGAQKDVPGFLSSLGVAVLASRAEGMSNAVLEYLAAARPVVATAVGATPELLKGECGLLVPPGDPAALAGAIARLLRDPALAARLAEAGRRRAVEEYSRAAMVRRFEEFYARLIHGRAAQAEWEGQPCGPISTC